jgi:predicted Co/Zn/Cd cation transporter (cation efflux family)
MLIRKLFFVTLCLISGTSLTLAKNQDTIASYTKIEQDVEVIVKKHHLEKSGEEKFIEIQLTSPKKDDSLESEILQVLPEHIENLFNKLSVTLMSNNVSLEKVCEK